MDARTNARRVELMGQGVHGLSSMEDQCDINDAVVVSVHVYLDTLEVMLIASAV